MNWEKRSAGVYASQPEQAGFFARFLITRYWDGWKLYDLASNFPANEPSRHKTLDNAKAVAEKAA